MEPKIIEFNETKVIGMKCTTTLINNTIPQLWDDYMKRFPEIPNKSSERVCYGICLPMEWDCQKDGDHTPFDYLAAHPVTSLEEIPEGMIAHIIPPGKYATFIHRGPLDNLGETYENIFSKWMRDYELEYDKREQLEVYDHRFKFGHPDSILEILVPVK